MRQQTFTRRFSAGSPRFVFRAKGHLVESGCYRRVLLRRDSVVGLRFFLTGILLGFSSNRSSSEVRTNILKKAYLRCLSSAHSLLSRTKYAACYDYCTVAFPLGPSPLLGATDMFGIRQPIESLRYSVGWNTQWARGINDSGQIVGDGIGPEGYGEALELTPIPEPTAFGIALIGLGQLSVRRRV